MSRKEKNKVELYDAYDAASVLKKPKGQQMGALNWSGHFPYSLRTMDDGEVMDVILLWASRRLSTVGIQLKWKEASPCAGCHHHLLCVCTKEEFVSFFFFLISKQILIKERKSSSRSQLLLITSDQISQKGKDGHIIRLCYKKPPHHHQPKRKQKTHHTRVVTGRVDFGSFLPHLIAQHTGGQSNRRVVGAAAARLESKFSRHIIIGKRMQNICRSTCDKYPIKNKEI